MNLANNLSKVKVIQKPSPFKRKQRSNMRRFLEAYEMWATAQGTALNIVDQQGEEVGLCENEWICATLNLGIPAMEEFAQGVALFSGEWAVFRREFKAHFETVDEAIDAKEKLRRQAEREREKRCSGASTGTATMQPSFPTTLFTPFIPPNTKPAAMCRNTMDVDATHIHDKFLCQMHGRCFGCGSTVHSRRDGNYNRDLCGYCKKFLKRAKGQKAAVMTEETVTTANTLAKLKEQQRVLVEKISVLEVDF
ncbi:hypothetical protein BGY98DRAFT_1089591 [Russula aff. rugulosa BPL654]|nr:hypothetical protein BGY98DRAFT_1089591 [Russula aff. rugulosa BPL654]